MARGIKLRPDTKVSGLMYKHYIKTGITPLNLDGSGHKIKGHSNAVA